jgi:hypothetical protein
VPGKISKRATTLAAETKRVNPLFDASAIRYDDRPISAAVLAGNLGARSGKAEAQRWALGLTQLRRGAKNARKNKFRG